MHINDEEEEQTGRILNDDEYIQSLKEHDAIFHIEKGNGLRYIEVAALAVSVIIGIVLSNMPAVKIAPVFYETIMKERMAKLSRTQVETAVQKNKVQKESGNQRGSGQLLVENDALKRQLKAAGFKSISMTQPNSSAVHEQGTARKNVTPSSDNREHPDIRGIAHEPSNESEVPVSDSNLNSQGVTNKAKETGPMPASLGSAGNAKDDSTLLSQGAMYKRQDNHDSAFAAFRSVLAHNPHNPQALSGMGNMFLLSGLLDSSITFYNKALAENPRLVSAHDGLGTVHYYVSEFASNPNYAARRNIGDPAKYAKAQFDSAIAEYTNAIRLDSTCVDAFTNRGVMRDINKDYKEAIKDYSLAIKINPSFADAYSKRAAVYKTLGKYKEAITDYTAAIARDSGSYDYDPTLRFANAYYGRGLVNFRMGHFDRAIADYDSTLKLVPDHELSMLHKAEALASQKQYDSAIVYFSRAIKLLSPLEWDGIQFFCYLNRGNVYKAQSRYDNAIADYKKSFESPSLTARSCWRLAECYCLKRDNETAISWLQKGVSSGFHNFKAWQNDHDLAPLWNTKEFRDITKRQ